MNLNQITKEADKLERTLAKCVDHLATINKGLTKASGGTGNGKVHAATGVAKPVNDGTLVNRLISVMRRGGEYPVHELAASVLKTGWNTNSAKFTTVVTACVRNNRKVFAFQKGKIKTSDGKGRTGLTVSLIKK